MKKNIQQLIGVKGIWTAEVREADGTLVSKQQFENLIPTVGLTALAAQISGTASKDVGDDLYLAVGTNATAPAAGDTQLGTEIARSVDDSATFSGAVAYVAAFFAAGEATGTLREFGLFGDGNATDATAAANSGILYSHSAANVTVTALQTLSLSVEITFSSV